jgi:hypothetical protein
MKKLIGKKIKFLEYKNVEKKTIILKDIKHVRGTIYFDIKFEDENGKLYRPDLRERIIIEDEEGS